MWSTVALKSPAMMTFALPHWSASHSRSLCQSPMALCRGATACTATTTGPVPSTGIATTVGTCDVLLAVRRRRHDGVVAEVGRDEQGRGVRGPIGEVFAIAEVLVVRPHGRTEVAHRDRDGLARLDRRLGSATMSARIATAVWAMRSASVPSPAVFQVMTRTDWSVGSGSEPGPTPRIIRIATFAPLQAPR
jgi:hypothetical protein